VSIDYYAVPTMDEDTVRAFISDDKDALTVSIPRERIATKLRFALPTFERFEKDYAALGARVGMTEAEARRRFVDIELNWRGEEIDGSEGYIQAVVGNYGVSISHGSGGGDRLMAALLSVIAALETERLYVWDPQRSDWLPTADS
jgi:hypothetical protein